MRLPALHVNGAKPTRPQDLGNAVRVGAIRLVGHRGQRSAHLPRFHADDVEPFCLQSIELMLA